MFKPRKQRNTLCWSRPRITKPALLIREQKGPRAEIGKGDLSSRKDRRPFSFGQQNRPLVINYRSAVSTIPAGNVL